MKRVLLLSALLALTAAWTPAAEVSFKKVVLDKAFRSEGVATGDVNQDGKLDVLAGDVWYAAPDWKMGEVRKVGTYDPKGYSPCFQNFAYDVNGDGWIDSIIVLWPGKRVAWYENPKNQPGPWKERVIHEAFCGETPLFTDLLGDGKPVLVGGLQPEGVVAWLSAPKNLDAPWDIHPITTPKHGSSAQYAHGYGVGDLDGDGRKDFLITAGWWEAPEDRTKSPWTFHPAPLGPECADMVVEDFDGDGDADVATTSAHQRGVWWFERVKGDQGITFQQHEIDKTHSQTHALILADINRDGTLDLVTGKRFWAHTGGDPGIDEPAVILWYEVRRPEKGKVEFLPHLVDSDSGVGTQFEVRDINGDGKLDIISSNKKGVHLLLQE
jgi:hypothetical protein